MASLPARSPVPGLSLDLGLVGVQKRDREFVRQEMPSDKLGKGCWGRKDWLGFSTL